MKKLIIFALIATALSLNSESMFSQTGSVTIEKDFTLIRYNKVTEVHNGNRHVLTCRGWGFARCGWSMLSTSMGIDEGIKLEIEGRVSAGESSGSGTYQYHAYSFNYNSSTDNLKYTYTLPNTQ